MRQLTGLPLYTIEQKKCLHVVWKTISLFQTQHFLWGSFHQKQTHIWRKWEELESRIRLIWIWVYTWITFQDNNGSDTFNDRLVDTVRKYRSNSSAIVAHVYGHTHTDSFRLFDASKRTESFETSNNVESDGYDGSSVGFVGGSVTPLVNWQLGTNPSIR